MDRVIEKTKAQKLMKYWPYVAGGMGLLVIGYWLLFGNHASTLRVSKDELTISEVRQAEFKDYVRTNGQVLPIQVVQISPEEGGIVMEKVVEEGTMVHPQRRGRTGREAEPAEEYPGGDAARPSEQPDGTGTARYGHPAQAAYLRPEQAALCRKTDQQGGLPAVAGGLSALCQEACAGLKAPEAGLHLSYRSDGPNGGQPAEHAAQRGFGTSAQGQA